MPTTTISHHAPSTTPTTITPVSTGPANNTDPGVTTNLIALDILSAIESALGESWLQLPGIAAGTDGKLAYLGPGGRAIYACNFGWKGTQCNIPFDEKVRLYYCYVPEKSTLPSWLCLWGVRDVDVRLHLFARTYTMHTHTHPRRHGRSVRAPTEAVP